ncbi:hypothetical protein L1887_38311 [Cichorium endivia]|nr:hypothetical protein L1887_38311 [Cichorium endivia]
MLQQADDVLERQGLHEQNGMEAGGETLDWGRHDWRWECVVLAIAILAAVVGSQAIITGTFSIIKQCSALGCFRRVKIIHTSPTNKHGQDVDAPLFGGRPVEHGGRNRNSDWGVVQVFEGGDWEARAMQGEEIGACLGGFQSNGACLCSDSLEK